MTSAMFFQPVKEIDISFLEKLMAVIGTPKELRLEVYIPKSTRYGLNIDSGRSERRITSPSAEDTLRVYHGKEMVDCDGKGDTDAFYFIEAHWKESRRDRHKKDEPPIVRAMSFPSQILEAKMTRSEFEVKINRRRMPKEYEAIQTLVERYHIPHTITLISPYKIKPIL
jgi:hypothetical protein